jgi:hypothetical protein
MRVRLSFRSPDPGYPVFIEVPTESVVGTVIKQYTGVHERNCVYIRLDRALELTVTDPTAPFGHGCLRVASDAPASGPTTGVVRISNVVGLCDDSLYRLARALITQGRGTASFANMILTRKLPKEFDLSRAQKEQRIPLTDRERIYLGYADIEVID